MGPAMVSMPLVAAAPSLPSKPTLRSYRSGLIHFLLLPQVVLVPVVAGALLNRMFPRQVARAAAFTPLLAVAMTVAICASIIAASAGSIQSVGLPLLLAVTALHTGEPASTRSPPSSRSRPSSLSMEFIEV